eukprot:TRINITY_DN10280_c0_g1_i1.p1 TRINITY_DN10280_c0_g1~~TRINITY_DN10280_c0_g1_i1.p1  ORF type:complete len:1309 (+),score=584.16 TRINITY_DN10280_c0_g1_i1:130-4056(+)
MCIRDRYAAMLRELEAYALRNKEHGDDTPGSTEGLEKLKQFQVKIDHLEEESKLLKDQLFLRNKIAEKNVAELKDKCEEANNELEKLSLDKLDQASEKFRRMLNTQVDPLLAHTSPAEEALTAGLEQTHQVLQDKYDQVFAVFQEKYRAQKTAQVASDLKQYTTFETELHSNFTELMSQINTQIASRYQEMFEEYSGQLQLLQGDWQQQRHSELQVAITDLHSYSEKSAAEEAEFRRTIKAKFARMAEENLTQIKQTTWATEQEEMDAWERKHREAMQSRESFESTKQTYELQMRERFDRAVQAAAEVERKLRDNLEENIQQETVRLNERRQALEAAHLSEVERMRAEALQKDKDLLSELKKGEERRVTVFETQLQEQADRIERLKVESFESDMKLWADREGEIRTRKAHIDLKMSKSIQQFQDKFETLMNTQRADADKSITSLDQQYAAALKGRLASLNEDRKNKMLTLKNLKQELEVSEVEQRQQLDEFELQLKTHFDKQERSMVLQSDEWRKSQAEEQLDLWEQKMAEFREREAQLERYKMEYEEQVRSKFDRLMATKHEEHAMRQKELEHKCELESKAAQRQLEEIEGKRVSADAQVEDWLAKAQQQEEANHEYEAQLEEKYRTELNSHMKQMDSLVEQHDAEQLAKWEERETELHARCAAVQSARHTREMNLDQMHARIMTQIEEEEGNAMERLEREFAGRFKSKEDELEAVRAKRAEMEAAIEEVMHRQLEMDAIHKQKEDELMRRYEEQLNSQLEAIALSLRTQSSNKLMHWEERQRGLLDQARSYEQDRLQFEEDLSSKYDQLLRSQSAQDDTLRHDLEMQYQKELKRKESQVQENLQRQHERRREIENKIREKYLNMVQRYQQEVKVTKKSVLDREVHNAEAKAALQRERSQLFEDAEREVEKEAKERYRALLLELQEDWRKEAVNREKRVEQMLREEYEARITMVQMRLDEATQADGHTMVSGLTDVTKYKAEQNKRLAQFAHSERERHEAMLAEYRRLEEHEIEQLESQVASAREASDSEENLQQQLERKVKTEFAEWRAMFQHQTNEKYHPMVLEIKDIHAKFTKVLQEREELEAANKGLQPKKERITALSEKLQREEREKVFAQAKQAREEEERRIEEKKVWASKLAEQQARLKELWDDLGVGELERHQFWKHVLLSNTHAAAAKMCQEEVAQLGEKLPILQMQMRIGQIQHRLEGLRAGSRKLAMDGSESEIRDKDAERENLLGELSSLSSQMEDALVSYQREHGEPFPHQVYKLASPSAARSSPKVSRQGPRQGADKKAARPPRSSPGVGGWR